MCALNVAYDGRTDRPTDRHGLYIVLAADATIVLLLSALLLGSERKRFVTVKVLAVDYGGCWWKLSEINVRQGLR